jgi:hypothetical protein
VWTVTTENPEISDANWQAARDEAVAALTEALTWELTESRWEQVSSAVEEIASAVNAARPDALWQTTGDLQLYASLRVRTRLGDTPPLPAPKALRERIAELVESLGGPVRGQAAGGSYGQ